MDLDTKNEIKGFIRGRLGCKCPENVFKQIDVVKPPADLKIILGDEFYQKSQLINVGGTLLILKLESGSMKSMISILEGVLNRGVEIRDTGGYNRFRLVVATYNQTDSDLLLRKKFGNITGSDKKVHLHVLSLDQLPEKLRWS